jgi:hypothetical protein
MERLSFADIVNDKRLTDVQLNTDLANLKKFSADKNDRKFCGNPFLYHYQIANLCKVKVNKKKSLYEKMNDDSLYEKLYNLAMSLNRTGSLATRLFEANRFNGAVVCFKASTAKYLYKKFGATKVLDPTAGWGGRMLGAWALDIDYTGIDTNISMIEAYEGMIEKLNSNMTMIFDNCLEVDFSTIEYDFVLTSPPYINLEVYEHMTPYESNKAYYIKFLIPLLKKCLANIKNSGYVCFNISPTMYDDLLKNGFRACDMEYDLLQQKRLGKDKQDKIYCWK